jgi:hypothetical protein
MARACAGARVWWAVAKAAAGRTAWQLLVPGPSEASGAARRRLGGAPGCRREVAQAFRCTPGLAQQTCRGLNWRPCVALPLNMWLSFAFFTPAARRRSPSPTRMSRRAQSYRDSAKEAQRLAIAQGGLTIKLMTAGLLTVTAAHSYWMWHRQHRQSALSTHAAHAATHRSGGPPSCAGPPLALDTSPRPLSLGCRREPAAVGLPCSRLQT